MFLFVSLAPLRGCKGFCASSTSTLRVRSMLGKDLLEVDGIIYLVFLAFIVRVSFLVHFAILFRSFCNFLAVVKMSGPVHNNAVSSAKRQMSLFRSMLLMSFM